MSPANGAVYKPPLRPRRFLLFAIIASSVGLLAGVALMEVVFRILERRENSHSVYEGSGGLWMEDGRWGWKPSLGAFRSVTSEFDVTGNINSLYMNDVSTDPIEDERKTRVFVLGDSHTYAVGVSMQQTWPRLLEGGLNLAKGQNTFRVYNGGVTGFNIHQYLLRLIDQGPLIHPDYVVVGLSYATDLYDLLPPDRGGWIYGGDRPRDYFDFNAEGELTERHWTTNMTPRGGSSGASTTAAGVRQILEYSATFRRLRRSKLSLFVGSHLTIKGQSLWPNMDIVLEKEVGEEHRYQWRLFEALLSRMKDECDRQGAKLIVVGIPYLPQVYDDVWDSTFGRDPRYSRTAAAERVESYCKKLNIPYVDTLSAFQAKTKKVGHWLHFPKDAHPTAEGHEVIASAVMNAGLIHSKE